MSVPVWLIVTLCTVAVDVRLGLVLASSNVKMPSCDGMLVCCIVVYPILLVPWELRAQLTCPIVELQVNITVSPGHTGVYEGELWIKRPVSDNHLDSNTF